MTAASDDRVEQLTECVAELSEQIEALISEVDELRDELQWRNRNARFDECGCSTPFRLTSMSLDPVADDFRINRVDESTIEQLCRKAGAASGSESQGSLF